MTEVPERTCIGAYGELVRSYEFCGLKAGQRVKLNGDYLSDRVQWATDWTWEILRLVTNIETGKQWVDLYGGSAKWAHIFPVAIEAIIKVDNRRR